jgi:hypothetical protein
MLRFKEILDMAVGAFLVITCFAAGASRIAAWFHRRAEDDSFSWRRILKSWAGDSPREHLLEGVLGLLGRRRTTARMPLKRCARSIGASGGTGP